MNIRQRKRIISIGAALFALGGAAVLVSGFTLPVRVEPEIVHGYNTTGGATADPANAAADPATLDPTRLHLNGLLQLCAVDLRRPLVDEADAQQQAQAKQPPAPAQLPIRLVGTILEPDHSMAIFMTDQQAIKLCRVGDSIIHNGQTYTLHKLESRKAAVAYAGKTYNLTIPKKR